MISSSDNAWNSAPLIAPGPRPSDAPMALAVIGLSPVIMRTSIPALSAVVTASFASARNGSIIPAIPTKARSWVSDIGSCTITSSSSSATRRAAKASTRRPCSPMRALAASRSACTSAIGTCEPLSGPPAWQQRAKMTSGPPFTSSMTCSAPSTVTRWNVAMNL